MWIPQLCVWPLPPSLQLCLSTCRLRLAPPSLPPSAPPETLSLAAPPGSLIPALCISTPSAPAGSVFPPVPIWSSVTRAPPQSWALHPRTLFPAAPSQSPWAPLQIGHPPDVACQVTIMAPPSIESAVGYRPGCALGHQHLATPTIISSLAVTIFSSLVPSPATHTLPKPPPFLLHLICYNMKSRLLGGGVLSHIYLFLS